MKATTNEPESERGNMRDWRCNSRFVSVCHAGYLLIVSVVTIAQCMLIPTHTPHESLHHNTSAAHQTKKIDKHVAHSPNLHNQHKYNHNCPLALSHTIDTVKKTKRKINQNKETNINTHTG